MTTVDPKDNQNSAPDDAAPDATHSTDNPTTDEIIDGCEIDADLIDEDIAPANTGNAKTEFKDDDDQNNTSKHETQIALHTNKNAS